ncbi:hypothetical protein ACHMW7_16175 [Aminobacter sp. UC22_36]|uniref:hypothetical protein n=1 Tax=Aminobacter sp. UC22_36 TaxID=3374549 RepID=UPI00375665C5
MASKSMGCSPMIDKEWEAESDLRSLIEAEKVKADPARLKAAMKKQAEMKKAIDAVGMEAKK